MSEFFNLIEQLLYEHECVIIPHFGGFVVNAQGFTFDKKEGKIHPKKKCIAFNEKLKTDDRFLSSEWAKNKSISLKEASAEILAFSKELKATLNSNSEVRIGVLGTFSLIKENRISFTPNSEFNADLTVFGLFPIGLGHNYPQKEKKLGLIPTPVVEDQPEIAPEEYQPVKLSKSIYVYALIAFFLGGVGAFFLTAPPSNQSQSSLNPINLEKKVISVPLVKEVLPEIDTIQPKALSAPVLVDNKQEDKLEIKQQDVIYLVAASFQSLSQAEKGLKEFKHRGFNQAEIILKNENTKYYRISVGTEHSLEAGYAKAMTWKTEKKVDIWVYKAL